MISKILSLKFMAIKEVELLHDYLSLTFSNGAVLNVFNKFSFEVGNGKNVTSLTEKWLVSVLEVESRVEMNFSGDGLLVINLTDDAYVGPEAMELIIPGEPPIVWN